MAGVGWSIYLFAEKSDDIQLSQITSFATSKAAIYLAPMVDRVVQS